jgi:hypothetical protein
MRKKWLWLFGGSILVVLAIASAAWAHLVFSISFSQTYITITKAGVYECDITIDPLYAKVGFVLMVDENSLPDGVFAMIMPPVGFFKYADDPPKTLKLTLIVSPKAEQGVHQMVCNLTQIIPPYEKDETTINGPALNISISK